MYTQLSIFIHITMFFQLRITGSNDNLNNIFLETYKCILECIWEDKEHRRDKF